MLSAVGRPLSVHTWLAVPLLFATAVLGLTALGGLLLDARWEATLSIAMFGPAAAVTALLSVALPESWATRCRLCLRIGYPGVIFATGLVVDGVTIPTPVAVTLGLPAVLVLVLLSRQDQHATSLLD